MPTIQPFRGLRYNLGQVGSLSDVVTPPYDVISPEFQDELYKKHPANFIRLSGTGPDTPDFMEVAKSWRTDAADIVADIIWRGYDQFRADVLLQRGAALVCPARIGRPVANVDSRRAPIRRANRDLVPLARPAP